MAHKQNPHRSGGSLNLVSWTDAVLVGSSRMGTTYPAGRPTGSSRFIGNTCQILEWMAQQPRI